MQHTSKLSTYIHSESMAMREVDVAFGFGDTTDRRGGKSTSRSAEEELGGGAGWLPGLGSI